VPSRAATTRHVTSPQPLLGILFKEHCTFRCSCAGNPELAWWKRHRRDAFSLFFDAAGTAADLHTAAACAQTAKLGIGLCDPAIDWIAPPT
jgi:hypothetical protein